ncbi:Vacuolar protein sorting-associated protein 62 [Serendipita sp. 400]|nr:Vacuolar protein sorting-associated protein 62 [Serendipita sp. 400]
MHVSLLGLSYFAFQVSASPSLANSILARKYAPQFRFEKEEVFYPSTVEYFLAGPVKLYNENGTAPNVPDRLTNRNLGSIENNGAGMYLTTDIDANEDGFLRGQNPTLGRSTTYAFIAPKDNGVVDLYYWVFSPFNLGKNVTYMNVGWVGNHVGDWERITVRTVNGVATSVEYHAHSNTASTIPWAQVLKFSPWNPRRPPTANITNPFARPVGYIANGSHGIWQSAGAFNYQNVSGIQLYDITSDDGVYWDTQWSLTMINYPDTYSGTLNWLNYAGVWGNKGQTDCWWYSVYPSCKVVTGPIGPARDDVLGMAKRSIGSMLQQESMRLPAQTLATISDGISLYSIRLGPLATNKADEIKTVIVKQYCADSQDTPVSHTLGYSRMRPATRHYVFEVPGCEEGEYVAAYTIGFCTRNVEHMPSKGDNEPASCMFGIKRQLRAFSKASGDNSPQRVQAVDVEDLDNWDI